MPYLLPLDAGSMQDRLHDCTKDRTQYREKPGACLQHLLFFVLGASANSWYILDVLVGLVLVFGRHAYFLFQDKMRNVSKGSI